MAMMADLPGGDDPEPASMDLKCLNYFVTVIESGSFARASARLRIAQPALGWQIRKLEEELGAQLLIRHSRGVEPTDAGLRMLGHARAILARAQEAAAELRSLTSEPQGTVVLGLTPSMNAMLTVPLLRRLSAEAPQIRVRPVEELSVVLTEWMATGRLDLAIGFPITSLGGLVWEPLLGEAIYFVERAKPGATTGGTITFAEAARRELVLTVTSQRYKAFLEKIAEPHGIEIKIVHQMQSVATLRDLLIQGTAATIMPLGVVAREVAAGTLAARRVIEPEINREVVLFQPDSRPPSKAEQIVVSMIRELVVDTMVQSPGFWVPIQPGVKLAMGADDAQLPRDSRQGANEDERFAVRAASSPARGKGERSGSFDDLLRR